MLVFLVVQPQVPQTAFDLHPEKMAKANDNMMDKLDCSAADRI